MTSVNLDDLLRQGVRREQAGDLRSAEVLYREVLARQPDHADALNRLAGLALRSNQPDAARRLLERAISLYPDAAGYHLNLSTALRQLHRLDDALIHARRAAELAPEQPVVQAALAASLSDVGELDEALTACETALALDPRSVEALLTLSRIQLTRICPRESMAAADRALALQPRNPVAHWNKALAALTAGELAVGWEDFEWRKQVFPRLRRNFPQREWQQQDLKGKTILLHCEGGFGDAIHFVRFVPQVVRMAWRVILECPEPLYELFKPIPGLQRLIVRDKHKLPPFDFHCALQSIPYNVGTTLETIPRDVPYLRAGPARVAHFAEQIAVSSGGAPKVGIAWAGSENPHDVRSRTLETFAPLARVPGVRFFSLQVGRQAREASGAESGITAEDLSSDVRDFADLAALVQNLDLVVSVDTSVAHLAGALAKPGWTLIPYVPDMRWLLDREDSPWYPTMRLFRQANRTDWDEPVQRMAAALAELVASRQRES